MISNGESFQSYVPSNYFGSTHTTEYKLILLLFFFLQRLHQPYRPLQPPERLHHPRSRCPRLPDLPLRDQRILARHRAEPAPRVVQRQEVRLKLPE